MGSGKGNARRSQAGKPQLRVPAGRSSANLLHVRFTASIMFDSLEEKTLTGASLSSLIHLVQGAIGNTSAVVESAERRGSMDVEFVATIDIDKQKDLAEAGGNLLEAVQDVLGYTGVEVESVERI